MAYESVKVSDIVDRAVFHNWSVPEFQRGFVWKPTQVRDLAESLWLDYPVGSVLLWDSGQGVQERNATDAKRPILWLVDGQQRATALCILFGRKPYWWGDAGDWEKTRRRYDVRFDIDAKAEPYFLIANAATRRTKGSRYIPLHTLLTSDPKKEEDNKRLEKLAEQVKIEGLCDGMSAMEVYARLVRLRGIRDKDVVSITVNHELEEVVEIFSRLNSKGTRVTEADIYLGVVAARSPGWVHSTFLPYLRTLADAGFDISPNLLFRSLTGVGINRVRFRLIPDDFWNEKSIQEGWQQTQRAWAQLIKRFREYGVLSNDPMPTEAALVTLVALMAKYPDDAFDPAFYWFLQASRLGRYSGSGTTSLEEDLRDIQESISQLDALTRMLKKFDHDRPIDGEDFLRDYGDARFGRFILYLLIYQNQAIDWDERGNRIGFDKTEALAAFRPQWHHIFPRKFLEQSKNNQSGLDARIDALANIAVIGPEINIRISAKDPMNYLEKYKITAAKLGQQYIDPDISKMKVEQYDEWLNNRAARLSKAANAFLDNLRASLPSN